MKQSKLRVIASHVVLTVALFFIADVQASAQKRDYQPGEKIEWKSYNYPETWVEATFVKATPDGSQPIIREMPNEFHKDGFQRATSWADIRQWSGTLANKTPVNNTEADNEQRATPTTADFGTGIMTQEQVLSLLQTRLGDNPFKNSLRLEQTKKELGEMIKQRGLDFRFESSTDFYNKLAKYGATSEIVFPLRDNYGEPTKQSWLMGAWNLGKIGASVDYVRNNRVYRQGEIGVANVGTLTIRADGTYVWKAGTKDSTSGQWRKATHAEMGSQGGDGIVLLKAKYGEDWLVTKDRGTTLKGDWIHLPQLNWRSIKEYGSRG